MPVPDRMPLPNDCSVTVTVKLPAWTGAVKRELSTASKCRSWPVAPVNAILSALIEKGGLYATLCAYNYASFDDVLAGLGVEKTHPGQT